MEGEIERVLWSKGGRKVLGSSPGELSVVPLRGIILNKVALEQGHERIIGIGGGRKKCKYLPVGSAPCTTSLQN